MIGERVLLTNSRRRILITGTTPQRRFRQKPAVAFQKSAVAFRPRRESGVRAAKRASRVLWKLASTKLGTPTRGKSYKSETLSNRRFSAKPTAAVRLLASNFR